MDYIKYIDINFDTIYYLIDILVQHSCLTIDEIKYLINIIDIKTLLNYNDLPNDFIDEYIIPKITEDDDINMNTIYIKPTLFKEKCSFNFKDVKLLIDKLYKENKLTNEQKILLKL
jgi:hypothetical protein